MWTYKAVSIATMTKNCLYTNFSCCASKTPDKQTKMSNLRSKIIFVQASFWFPGLGIRNWTRPGNHRKFLSFKLYCHTRNYATLFVYKKNNKNQEQTRKKKTKNFIMQARRRLKDIFMVPIRTITTVCTMMTKIHISKIEP